MQSVLLHHTTTSHYYITLLHHTTTSHYYITLLHHTTTSHYYITLLHPTSWISILILFSHLCVALFIFWLLSFTFNSSKSPTWCNSFSVYCRDDCLQLNMFRAFSRPSSGAQWMQCKPLVLPSYRGESRAVFVVWPAGRPDDGRENARNTLSCKQTSG